MQLRELARYDGVAWPQNIRHVGQAAGNARRRLEPDRCCRQLGELGDLRATRALCRGKKPGEHEPVGRQTGHGQRGKNGAGPGNGDHRDPSVPAGGDKLVAGVGDERRSRITDQRHLPPGLELFKKPWPYLGPIVVMIGYHPCGGGGAGQPQQLASCSCILAGDDIGTSQRGGGTRREIAEIADRCCYNGEGAGSGHERAVRV